ETPTPVPSARVPNYPRELEHIVMKALAKNPNERYPTAQALQLDLEEFAREHKLAMSSVRIAKLMGALFEKRNDAWIRAQRAHSDHFIEVGATPAPAGHHTPTPGFPAAGSAPSTPSSENPPLPTAAMLAKRIGTGQSGLSAAAATARRSPTLWLVGAVLAAAVTVAVTVVDHTMTSAGDK